MTPTCLTVLHTLSTSMTLPRRRRRTWNNPHLICSTRLKHRSVWSPQSLSPVIRCCWCLVWLCIPLVPALCQIFKLMKMDSYRRFVRSPLYQSCTLASVEGKPLPQPARLGSWEDVAIRSPSLSDKKVEWNGLEDMEGKNMWFDLILISLFWHFFIAVSNRTRRQTPTACQVERVPRRSSARKEDHGEVVPVQWLILFFWVMSWFKSCEFISPWPGRCIQYPWFSPWKRAAYVSEIEQQCGARLPLQADRGQCIYENMVLSWCCLIGNWC